MGLTRSELVGEELQNTIEELTSQVEYCLWDLQMYSDPEHQSCGGIDYGVALAHCNDLIRKAQKLQSNLEFAVIEKAADLLIKKCEEHQAELGEIDKQVEEHQKWQDEPPDLAKEEQKQCSKNVQQ